ncbi:MAG: hypothetical protein IT324_19525 [Anaerolineae bacterium]|nr:hypothetical protein [Anaerolineae bacterium]
MIPQSLIVCPQPSRPQRFPRFRRGDHLRRELMPGLTPLALPVRAITTPSAFSYDNMAFTQIPAPARREIVPAIERLLDQVARFALGQISETEFEGATKRFRDSVFAAAPTPMMQQPVKPRREPPPLRQTGNLPWSRPQRTVITRPVAMNAEGKKLLAYLDEAPTPGLPRRELILPTLDKLDEDIKAAFTKGMNNVQ